MLKWRIFRKMCVGKMSHWLRWVDLIDLLLFISCVQVRIAKKQLAVFFDFISGAKTDVIKQSNAPRDATDIQNHKKSLVLVKKGEENMMVDYWCQVWLGWNFFMLIFNLIIFPNLPFHSDMFSMVNDNP